MKRSLKEVAELVQARLLGDGEVEVTGIASMHSAVTGDLVFVEDEKNLAKALQSGAAAVIAGEFAAKNRSPKPLLISDQPRLAFARAAKLLGPHEAVQAGVHQTAIIHPSAKIGESVTIEERSVVR